MAPSNEITDGNSKIYGKKYEIKIHIVQNWTHEQYSASLLFLKPCSFSNLDDPHIRQSFTLSPEHDSVFWNKVGDNWQFRNEFEVINRNGQTLGKIRLFQNPSQLNLNNKEVLDSLRNGDFPQGSQVGLKVARIQGVPNMWRVDMDFCERVGDHWNTENGQEKWETHTFLFVIDQTSFSDMEILGAAEEIMNRISRYAGIFRIELPGVSLKDFVRRTESGIIKDFTLSREAADRVRAWFEAFYRNRRFPTLYSVPEFEELMSAIGLPRR